MNCGTLLDLFGWQLPMIFVTWAFVALVVIAVWRTFFGGNK